MSSNSPLMPILPSTGPINIEDIYNDEVFIRQESDSVVIMYDRLMRLRPNAFYRHKREQLVYFIYSTNMDSLYGALRVISDCLDREDAAAEDLNKWLGANQDKVPPLNVKFHNLKVFQADESRDVAELASARTVFVNKIIVEYDYHSTDTPTSRYT